MSKLLMMPAKKFCPKCKYEYYPPEHMTIDPGDYCVCPNCGMILVIGANLQPTVPTVAEWNEVICNAELLNSLKELQHQIVLRNLMTERTIH